MGRYSLAHEVRRCKTDLWSCSEFAQAKQCYRHKHLEVFRGMIFSCKLEPDLFCSLQFKALETAEARGKVSVF